jgi:hypothetical protein
VPVITVTGSNVIQQGQTVTLTSTQATGYLWSNGANTRSITVSTGGNYFVTVYAGSYCSATSLSVSVIVLSARLAAPTSANTETIIYPNPAHDKINLRMNSITDREMTVALFDVVGKPVSSYKLNLTVGENDNELQLPMLSKGIYYLRFENEIRKVMID